MKWHEEDTKGVHYNMIVKMASLCHMGVEISIDLDDVAITKEVKGVEEFMLGISAIVPSVVSSQARP